MSQRYQSSDEDKCRTYLYELYCRYIWELQGVGVEEWILYTSLRVTLVHTSIALLCTVRRTVLRTGTVVEDSLAA